MKIDDPKVQAYISGQLSEDEEAALLSELEDHPEVSDLAETLKRTQRLIDQDKTDGTVPEVAQKSNIPQSAMARTFEPMMGQNWKVELSLIAGTVVALFLILIIVPVVKSFSEKTEEGKQTQFQQETLEALEEKAKGSKVIREADTSFSGGGSSSSVSASFDAQVMGGGVASVAANASAHSRVSGFSKAKRAEITAPVQVDFIEGAKTIEKLKAGQKVKPSDINISEFVNSFSATKTQSEELNLEGPTLVFEAEGSKAPWSSKWVFTTTLVAIGSDEETLPREEKQILFLGLSEKLHRYFESESESKIFKNISSSIDSFESKFERNHLVVYLGTELGLEQSTELKKWAMKPKNQLSVVDVTGKLRESVRRDVGPESQVDYISASTPFMLKKAFFNYLGQKEGPTHQIRLHLASADQAKFGVSLVGADSDSGSGEEDLGGAWMFPGERVTQVYEIESFGEAPSAAEKVLGLNLNYIVAEGESPTRGASNSVLVRDFSSANLSPVHRKSVTLTWLGLILKGDLSLDEKVMTQIEEYAAPLDDSELNQFLLKIRNLYL